MDIATDNSVSELNTDEIPSSKERTEDFKKSIVEEGMTCKYGELGEILERNNVSYYEYTKWKAAFKRNNPGLLKVKKKRQVKKKPVKKNPVKKKNISIEETKSKIEDLRRAPCGRVD